MLNMRESYGLLFIIIVLLSYFVYAIDITNSNAITSSEVKGQSCNCCSSCSAEELPHKTILNGKNRRRNVCKDTHPPADRRPNYDWRFRPILIAVEKWPPYINVTGNTSLDIEIHGPMADLLAFLAQTINFQYCLVRNEDEGWGTRDANGSYTGVYGMIQRNEVDMVLGPIFRTVDRSKIMKFSTTVHFENLAALFGQPTVSRNIYNYAQAFTWQVWLVILFTLCCVGATAVFLYTCGPDPKKNHPLTLDFAIEQFWLFFGVMVSQGMSSPPTRCPVRVLNSFWWLLAIIITAYYNSKLIALMVTVRSYDSLEDLLRPESSTNVIISSSTLADIKDVKSLYMILRGKSDNGTDSDVLNDFNMDLVAYGDYAIVAFRSDIQTAVSRRFTDRKICEFNTGADSYTFTKEMAMGYAKNMNYTLRRKIDLALYNLYEKGVFKSMLRKVLNTKVNCMLSPALGGGSMSLDDVRGMLLLWLYGMTSALVLLVIEGLHYTYLSNNKLENDVGYRKRKNTMSLTTADARTNEGDKITGFVVRRSMRRRQSRGFVNRPFYLAYNTRLPNQESYHFG